MAKWQKEQSKWREEQSKWREMQHYFSSVRNPPPSTCYCKGVRLSLSNELDILFSPSIRIQAQTIKPETVDALAVDEAVGALLLLNFGDKLLNES